MKKINIITALALSVFFVSCDMNDENEGRFESNPETGWVQFASDAPVSFIYGQTEAVAIPVELHTATNKGGTEIHYSITDVVGNSSGIIPERTGSFKLELDEDGVGTLTGDMLIPINDEAGLDSSVEFDVTITGTNKAGIEVGLSDDSRPITVRVKICATNIGTTYNGSSVVPTTTPASPADGYEGPDWVATVTPVAGQTNQYTIDSAWGPGFLEGLAGPSGAGFDYPAILTVNDDFTVTVTGNDPAFANRYLGGSGTYDPCSDTFRLNLRQGFYPTLLFTIDVVLTPGE